MTRVSTDTVYAVSIVVPRDGASIPCTPGDPCPAEVAGTLAAPLDADQALYLVIRLPAQGFLVQFGPKTVCDDAWAAHGRLGSPIPGSTWELWAIVVDTSVTPEPPTGLLVELSTTTIPGLLAVAGPQEIVVEALAATFADRALQHLKAQQHPATGALASYRPNSGMPCAFLAYLVHTRVSFTYDLALAALAFFARGTAEDLSCAQAILDLLLSIQDPATGGIPDAVNAQTAGLITAEYGTGNQMWAVLAFLKGYRMLGNPAYLDAAENVGNFVLQQKNTVGHGGFVVFPGSTVVSTEHCADAHSAFSQLADALSAQNKTVEAETFRNAARHARIFVESRYDPITGKTFTGTDGTGVATNPYPVPEDAQTWTLLSLGRSKWIACFQWMLGPTGVWTTSSACPTLGGVTIRGPAFSNADLRNVWPEGLAHARVTAQFVGDNDRAVEYGSVLEALQLHAPHADQGGLVATCDTLRTGFGFSYFNALAVAPTAWAVLGAYAINPFTDQSTSGDMAVHPDAAIPSVTIRPPAAIAINCPAGDPCLFTISGTSSGVAEDANRQIFVLVKPVHPSAGAIFTQFPPATVEADGTWTTTAQLGNEQFPVSNGYGMEVSAIIVDTSVAAPPATLAAVTADIPGLVSTSGLFTAGVIVAPVPVPVCSARGPLIIAALVTITGILMIRRRFAQNWA